jgi:hypothetical protein
MITLAFQAVSAGPDAQVRAAFFRICADATLRGPDNDIAATFIDHRWLLGNRRYTAFQCRGPVSLRVTHQSGDREQLGPYEFVRAAQGALYTSERCLGMHVASWASEMSTHYWREIALLTVR